MTYANIANATADTRTGVAMIPSSIPAGWSGKAAVACQADLDDANLLLAGLDALLVAAGDAAAALDNTASQCVVASS